MEIIESKKIIEKVNGCYLCEISSTAKKLKEERFPSNELLKKYPEDFREIHKVSTTISPPKLSG